MQIHETNWRREAVAFFLREAGLDVDLIARRLGVRPETVKVYANRARKKLLDAARRCG